MFAMPSCISSILPFTFSPIQIGTISQDMIDELEISHAAFAKKEESYRPVVLSNGGSIGMSDSEFIAQAFQNGNVIIEGSAIVDRPIKSVGTTRVELRVNNPDGTDTLVASVDNGNLNPGEKSLEERISEAVSANSAAITSSPIANALANAKKNQH